LLKSTNPGCAACRSAICSRPIWPATGRRRACAWTRPWSRAAPSSPTSCSAAPPRLADRLHAAAVESFRQARFAEAYGRFMALADAGHAPSAGIALWMWQHGPDLFGKDWDCSGEQLEEWSRLAGVPTPPLLARSYGRQVLSGEAPRPAATRSAPPRPVDRARQPDRRRNALAAEPQGRDVALR
jgi:hypothetical protein